MDCHCFGINIWLEILAFSNEDQNRYVEPWRTGRKEWQKGVVKSRIDKRSLNEVELPQGLLQRNRVELRKSNDAPIKVGAQAVIHRDTRRYKRTGTSRYTHGNIGPAARSVVFGAGRT